jgi:hypothetical protein
MGKEKANENPLEWKGVCQNGTREMEGAQGLFFSGESSY